MLNLGEPSVICCHLRDGGTIDAVLIGRGGHRFPSCGAWTSRGSTLPSVTFVLVVPSSRLSRVGSIVFLGRAFLLRGFGGLGAFSSVGRLRIMVVAVVADRPIGWIGVVFLG